MTLAFSRAPADVPRGNKADVSHSVFDAQVAELLKSDGLIIPPYPGVAMRVRQLVDRGTYALGDLARLVAEDQALASAVLRAANAAARRGVQAVTTLKDAIVRLGGEELARIALASSLHTISAGEGPLATVRRLAWRRGLASGVTCRHLASARGLPPEEAFVCGLLHDFGRLVVVAAVEKLLSKAPTERRSEAEWLQLVDRHHLEVGLITAARWNLSARLQVAIAHHHAPAQAAPAHAPAVLPTDQPMVDLVRTSDVIVELLERVPFVLARDLLALPDVRGAREADHLMMVLPLLPRFLTSIDEAGQPAKPAAGDAKAPVTRVLPAERRFEPATGAMERGAATLEWVRSSGDVRLTVESSSDSGVAVRSRDRLPEQKLVWLRLPGRSSEAPLELCARVVLSEPSPSTASAASAYRSELLWFSFTEAQQRAWRAYRELPRAA